MIIFGTRGVTTTPDRGTFYCPTCRMTRNYEFKRVRRFFTLYFIPLIPLDLLGEYVECTTCSGSYRPEILDYDQSADDGDFQAEYIVAVKKVMIHMLLADGVIDDSEIQTALNIYKRLTSNELDKNQFLQEIKTIQTNNENLSTTLKDLQGALNNEGKELVVKAALLIALADGEFQEEEQIMLSEIGHDLGMSEAHIQGVLASA